ncbi:MAG TPA: DUF3617 family protein [Novosphingobium sp.]|nr:DUF3617 family protein [Novosphingobium sp.]
MTRLRPLLRLSAALACLAGGAALAQGVHLAVLDKLEPGLWELRMRGEGRSERICASDVRRLIQLRHPQATCRQFVVEDEATVATVHYTCTGQGAGRTRLRVESPRLVQLESSGVAGKLPFDIVAEARRIGTCSTS